MNSSREARPRAIDVHAHVIVPEVYAVAAEHNVFSELPTDPGVTDEMRGRIKERAVMSTFVRYSPLLLLALAWELATRRRRTGRSQRSGRSGSSPEPTWRPSWRRAR